MKSLLIVAHGSRRAESNNEIRELTARIAEKAGSNFDIVECAFLELAEPSIPDGIQCCINQGSNDVTVVPYFLSAGRHVIKDIPEDVDKAKSRNPDANIKIAPYLGSYEQVADIMLDQALTHA